MAEIEMREFDRPEVEARPEVETIIDLPEVPVDQTRTLDEVQREARIEKTVDSIRKNMQLGGPIDKNVYKQLTLDEEGYLYYEHKRLTSKRGNKFNLLSVNTLQKHKEGRDFLKMIGFDSDREKLVKAVETNRELETVAPEQSTVIKAKIDSFKVTEQYAKHEKEKATRQLGLATSDSDKQKLRESVQYFEQMELQARQRYKELTENQLKRLNEIINDKSRSLTERLKELFRRDGVTVGAVITGLGMTISTIVLAVWPSPTPSATPPTSPAQNNVKSVMVKLANWFLDMAKKAVAALPGLLGPLISFLFKKAGQAVLFLSEHLVLLVLTILLAVVEFFVMRRRKTE